MVQVVMERWERQMKLLWLASCSPPVVQLGFLTGTTWGCWGPLLQGRVPLLLCLHKHLFFKIIYLFWLCWVLVAAHGIFTAAGRMQFLNQE